MTLTVCLAAWVFVGEKKSDDGLLILHNRERAERRLEALALDPKLCEYAQSHADRMAERGRMVHSSMSNLAEAAGNGNVGENIAWGQESEEQVTDAWMKSPGHRQNILSKRFKRCGFGVKKDKNGRNYWCAVFAG